MPKLCQILENAGMVVLGLMTNMRRAIWLEIVGPKTPLDSKVDIQNAVSRLVEFGITDVFTQVYREGRNWFHSSKSSHLPGSFDPLGTFLQEIAPHGIKVHAWINVFNLHSNSDASILKQLGSEALLVDNQGISVAKYGLEGQAPQTNTSRLDTPKLWLDPSNPQVFSILDTFVADLLAKYQSLAGLHLDFFRYPYILPIKPSSAFDLGLDYGFSEEARLNFEKVHGPTFERDSHGTWQIKNQRLAWAWDDQKRAGLDKYLAAFRSKLRSSQELSVAVIPWADRAYLNAFQNWRKWLLQDLVDHVCLMNYTSDMQAYEYAIRQAQAFCSRNSKIWSGIGTYLLEPQEIKVQVDLTQKLRTDGVALFSFKNMQARVWEKPW